MMTEVELLYHLKREKYSLVRFLDTSSSGRDLAVFASPNLSSYKPYLRLVMQSVTRNSFLMDCLPSGCYIIIFPDIHTSNWEGDMIGMDFKSPKITLPVASFSVFPSYTFERSALEGFFRDNKYHKETMFASSTMQKFFTKIRNNIQTLSWKILATLKSMPITDEFCAKFHIFHEIFQVFLNV